MSLWMIALAAYFAVGLALAFIGPAADQRRHKREKLEMLNRQQPAWKFAAFSAAVAFAVIMLWPLAISAAISERRAPKNLWDALQQDPAFQEQQKLFDAMSLMCEDGVDADELPNGRGEFGLVPSNPIPCKTVFGSTAYLGRLCASDGAKVIYNRVGSFRSDVSPHPVDAYEISHPDGQKLATIFISPYQRRISGKAPRGFMLPKISLGQ
jgi:hypothetical protein